MKLNFTSGLVLVLIFIFATPVAVLSYRALNSPPEPSTAPTTQIRMLDSPLTRITYSIPEVKSKPKPTPKPKPTRNTPTPVPPTPTPLPTSTPVPPTPTATPLPTATPTPTATPSPPFGTIMASIVVGDEPYYLAYDGSHIWVTLFSEGRVKKIDPATNAVVGSYFVGVQPHDIFFDGTSIWVGTHGTGDIIQLRPSDGFQLNSIHLGDDPRGMAFDGTHLWVAQQQGGGKVSKVRVSDGVVVGTFATGDGTNDVVFDGENIWTSNFSASNITSLRASDGQLLQTIPGGGRPSSLEFDGTTVWVGYADHRDNQQPGNPTFLQRFAISDGSLASEVASGHVLDLAFDGEHVWATHMVDNFVNKFRISDGQNIGNVQLYNGEGNAYGIIYAAGHVWVADPDFGTNNLVSKIWPD